MDLASSTIIQLRAFEAVGRNGSFKRAAEELFVTQAALSHHVRHLEQHLGVQLVKRLHRRIELTAEGGQLLADAGRALEALSAALRNLRRTAREDALTVSVPPYFSLCWLTPRLGSLWRRHPGINLLLHHTYRIVDFAHDKIDAAITWGHGKWPEVESTLLMTSRLTPICTPEYLARLGGKAPADLLRHPLFYEFDQAHWRQWFAAAGVDGTGPLQGVRIDDTHALRRVVLDGHGFGLFFVELIQDDVRTGKLVQPFDLCIDPGCAYYLNRPRDTPMGAKLQTFTRWILEEAAGDPSAPPRPEGPE
jgi:DNA-binding transcriptional LysR family regulator